ncbi:MAG: hypothetical protein ACYDG3_08420 [Bacillati bacterium]
MTLQEKVSQFNGNATAIPGTEIGNETVEAYIQDPIQRVTLFPGQSAIARVDLKLQFRKKHFAKGKEFVVPDRYSIEVADFSPNPMRPFKAGPRDRVNRIGVTPRRALECRADARAIGGRGLRKGMGCCHPR